MRIPPNNISFKKSPEGVNPNNPSVKKSGDAFLGKTERADLRKNVSSVKAPISRQELMALASDFKNGLIDKEEMNSRFINTIVNNSLKGKLSAKDCEKIVSDISEFFSHDQEFIKGLEKNLSQLT